VNGLQVTVHESVRVVTPLGVALHDLLSDARITDGLVVTARPLAGGRVTRAFQTRSGAHAFRGLDGLLSVELPDPAEPEGGVPAVRDFHVTVVDVRGRFLPLVLEVPAPTRGLVTQAVLGGTSASLLPDDLPVYLFSAPTRPLPAHLAAVRAQLVDQRDGGPAAFAWMEVLVGPAGPGRRRHIGLAGEDGAVVVPFAYPRFSTVPGGLGSIPAAGTRGEPTADREWPVEIRVHAEPDVLVRPAGLPAPVLSSVLAQARCPVWPTTAGMPADSLDADLRYGSDLVLRTAGDPLSRLLVGTPAP
jgi:hypothetical protein